MAQEITKQKEEEARQRFLNETKTDLQSTRPPANRKRTIEFQGKPAELEPDKSNLHAPAVTVYSHSHENGLHLHGMSKTPKAATGHFGKNTHFSKPMAEFHADTTRTG